MKIQAYIEKLKEEGLTDIQVAHKLGVSQSMVSAYKKGYNASYEVAKKVYRDTYEVAKKVYGDSGVVLFPFSKEGVSE